MKEMEDALWRKEVNWVGTTTRETGKHELSWCALSSRAVNWLSLFDGLRWGLEKFAAAFKWKKNDNNVGFLHFQQLRLCRELWTLLTRFTSVDLEHFYYRLHFACTNVCVQQTLIYINFRRFSSRTWILNPSNRFFLSLHLEENIFNKISTEHPSNSHELSEAEQSFPRNIFQKCFEQSK
jgi:hypothetical protein